MSQFTTPCRVELIGKNLFKLLEPFEYHIGEYPSEQIIKVPVGFITDFASIPRIFWPIVSPIDEYAKAAVIHDWMYKFNYAKKSVCEKIFYEAMTVLEVPQWKKICIYSAVYVGGWYTWIRYRRLYDYERICV